MKWVKRIFLFVFLFCAAVLLNYYLPSHDVVQVVSTDVKRMDINKGSPFWDRQDAGTEENTTRDVRFIYSVRPNGKERVFRNEDTGWSFPFYFKFDSSDLAARAQNFSRSNEDNWVVVKHYGWRIRLFSIFPNAVEIEEVDGPDARIIPWFNIVLLSLLAIAIFLIWRSMHLWKKKNVTPHTDKLKEELEDIGDTLGEHKDKLDKELAEKQTAAKGFMRRWFGSS